MCPWYTQFKEMGLPDAGHVYCAHLDNSICRGFNPYLTYLVPETAAQERLLHPHHQGCQLQGGGEAPEEARVHQGL